MIIGCGKMRSEMKVKPLSQSPALEGFRASVGLGSSDCWVPSRATPRPLSGQTIIPYVGWVPDDPCVVEFGWFVRPVALDSSCLVKEPHVRSGVLLAILWWV